MTQAIVAGLLAQGTPPSTIYVVDRHLEKRNFLAHIWKVHVSDDLLTFLPEIDVLILAIKPQGHQETCEHLAPALVGHSPLVISVLAGVTLARLNAALGQHLTIVRAAPNTPAKIQLGATGLFAGANCSPAERITVEKIVNATGIFAWVEREDDLNIITALSGSGPAYYFYLIELMTEAAIKLGLAPEIAKKFALQTAYGASKMAYESITDVKTLRAEVTSKKGTTEAAVTCMTTEGLPQIVEHALQAAYARGLALN